MRTKIVAILLVLVVAVVAGHYAIARLVVLPQFVALERQEAERNIERVKQAIAREVEQVARVARDYASWDDTCRFIETGDPKYIRSSAGPQVFPTLKLNLIHFYDVRGKLVWGETRDSVTGEPMRLAGLPDSGFPSDSPLVHHSSASHSATGLTRMGGYLMVAASYPILSSEGQGPVRGAVVFGRLLTKTDEQRLSGQSEVRFELLTLMPKNLPPGYRPGAGDGSELFFDDSQEDSLLAFCTVCGIDGDPIRLLRVDLARDIMAKGREVLRDSQYFVFLASVLLLVVAYWSFGHFVIEPTRQLTEHVLWIRQSGDLSKRIGIRKRDEVGTLAAEFDTLLAQLDRSRVALRRSENRFKAIVQDQTDLICRFLPDKTVTFVNRAFARYFGKSEDSVLGRKFDLPVPEEERAKIDDHLRRLNESSPVAEVEHRVVLQDGEVRRLQWTTRAICDRDGRLAEYQTVGRDVTDRFRDDGPDLEKTTLAACENRNVEI